MSKLPWILRVCVYSAIIAIGLLRPVQINTYDASERQMFRYSVPLFQIPDGVFYVQSLLRLDIRTITPLLIRNNYL